MFYVCLDGWRLMIRSRLQNIQHVHFQIVSSPHPNTSNRYSSHRGYLGFTGAVCTVGSVGAATWIASCMTDIICQLYEGIYLYIYIYIRCLFWWIYEPTSTIESVKSFEHCSVELHVKSDGWCIEHKNARDEEFRILYLEICHCDELKSEKNGFDNFVGNMWERIWCLTTFHHMRDQGHPQGLLPSWSMSRIATVTDELGFVKWPSFPPLVLEKADRAEFNRFSKISNCKVTMLQPAC